jgi:hypothetical protein
MSSSSSPPPASSSASSSQPQSLAASIRSLFGHRRLKSIDPDLRTQQIEQQLRMEKRQSQSQTASQTHRAQSAGPSLSSFAFEFVVIIRLLLSLSVPS